MCGVLENGPLNLPTGLLHTRLAMSMSRHTKVLAQIECLFVLQCQGVLVSTESVYLITGL